MRWKDKMNIKLNILIIVTYKKNQMNVLEITKYSILNKELIGGFSCRINTTKYRTSKFEEIPKQRSMYVRHKEQRKTTTKKQKPKGKKKKNPEMSKKELRDIVKKFSVCVIGKGFQGGIGGEGPACQCRSCRRLRFNP